MVITPSETCLAQQQEDVFATHLQAVRNCMFCLNAVMPQDASLLPGKLCGYSQK